MSSSSFPLRQKRHIFSVFTMKTLLFSLKYFGKSSSKIIFSLNLVIFVIFLDKNFSIAVPLNIRVIINESLDITISMWIWTFYFKRTYTIGWAFDYTVTWGSYLLPAWIYYKLCFYRKILIKWWSLTRRKSRLLGRIQFIYFLKFRHSNGFVTLCNLIVHIGWIV